MRTTDELAPEIRRYVAEHYIGPARQQGVREFKVRVGDVRKDLGPRFQQRTPAIASALKSHKFLKENGLRLVEVTGPPSGQSTTVEYTYEFAEQQNAGKQQGDLWESLLGAWKDVWEPWGGGENFIKRERAQWKDRDLENLK